MTDLFLEDDLKTLSDTQKAICLSIYIPTHESGMEVNENMDRTAFKNEVQALRRKLEGYDFDKGYIEELLSPAMQLIDNLMFWKDLSLGLAVFIKAGFFKYFRLPVSFSAFSVISSRFVISPIVPAFILKNSFCILSINKYEFKLFSSNKSEIKEIEIEEDLRKKAEEALMPVDYLNDFHEPLTENRQSQVMQKTKEKGDVNIPAFFKSIDDIVSLKLKDMGEPLLVLAGLKEWQGDYRKLSRYKNIYEQAYDHNTQYISPRELHEHVIEIVRPYLEKPLQEALVTYRQLAGSGKTSYNINNIIFDAKAGRVDTLFISKDAYLWGKYDEKKNELLVEDGPDLENYCLLNDAMVSAINNKGKIFMLEKNQMPENSSIVAVFRY
jgi:hypothetical protein